MNNQSYVAFLDILGFKDLVTNNSHEELVSIYKKSLQISLQMSLSNGKIKYAFDKEGKSIAISDLSNANVHSLIISDSVILWTDDSSMKSFIDILIAVRNMVNNSFVFGIPMRGAISIGDLTFIKNDIHESKHYAQDSLIGTGLLKSYEMETGQNWAGCIIDPDCIAHYQKLFELYQTDSETADIEYLIQKNILLRYSVPRKTGPIKDDYVVNWVRDDFINEDFIKKSFSKHNKRTDNWDVQSKIQNTILFYHFVKTHENTI